jgi:hypothetical protein
MRPFRGSEALAAGTLTRGQLRWHHTQIFPDVYVHKAATMTDEVWAEAASVWTRGEGSVAGRTAARLLGAYRIPAGGPVEVISSRRRPPEGLVLRAEHVADDEILHCSGYKLTTAARTALDLGRHLPRNDAVVILDALARAAGVTYADVDALADRYRGTRGIVAARNAAWLMDGGAQSEKETRLRLHMIDAGLPRPQTQLTIGDNHNCTVVPFGWPDVKVGVDFIRPDASHDIYQLRREGMHLDAVQFHNWFVVGLSDQEIPRLSVGRVYQAFRVRQRGL